MQPSENPKIAALNRRQGYTNHWKVPLMKTCTADPAFCCFALWCCEWRTGVCGVRACSGQCASYSLRKQALYGDMTRYICCNGMCPCSGRMGEKSCPGFCLCMEAWCCFAQSVATTRWMIQDELQVETTKCDNCIIGTMIALQYISCICHILACFFEELHQVATLIDCLADCTWCTVCACMQTQHKVQLDERDANPAARPMPMQPPGVQMIAVQPGYGPPPPMPYPPQAPAPGYAPPQQAYAYPPQSAYPPQPYPPQAYAPQAAYAPPGAYPPQQPGAYSPAPAPGAYPPAPGKQGMQR